MTKKQIDKLNRKMLKNHQEWVKRQQQKGGK